jgi:hypothetical protein
MKDRIVFISDFKILIKKMFVVVLGTHGNPPSECSYSILFLKNPQEKTGKI